LFEEHLKIKYRSNKNPPIMTDFLSNSLYVPENALRFTVLIAIDSGKARNPGE
jgi:hypothetical protein